MDKLPIILIPGVSVGSQSLNHAMDKVAQGSQKQSKQKGKLNKVIYEIEDACAYDDGEDRVVHRLFVKVLTHEIVQLHHHDDSDSEGETELETAKLHQVHFIRMKSIPRDYGQTFDEFMAKSKGTDLVSEYEEPTLDDQGKKGCFA